MTVLRSACEMQLSALECVLASLKQNFTGMTMDSLVEDVEAIANLVSASCVTYDPALVSAAVNHVSSAKRLAEFYAFLTNADHKACAHILRVANTLIARGEEDGAADEQLTLATTYMHASTMPDLVAAGKFDEVWCLTNCDYVYGSFKV